MSEHGRAVPGPMRHPACLCGARGVRSDRWDAYYCPTSGAWLEPRCSDECTCEFCKDRPEKAPIASAELPPVRWYGSNWGGNVCAKAPHVDTPVGAKCHVCEEPIEADHRGLILGPDEERTVFHQMCFFVHLMPVRIHRLVEGHAACGFHPGLPRDWPQGPQIFNYWSHQSRDVNCEGCKAAVQ